MDLLRFIQQLNPLQSLRKEINDIMEALTNLKAEVTGLRSDIVAEHERIDALLERLQSKASENDDAELEEIARAIHEARSNLTQFHISDPNAQGSPNETSTASGGQDAASASTNAGESSGQVNTGVESAATDESH